ncbi:MAG: phenylacetate--CoA ligase [Clostridiales bacterium]|nr:phenylacetate--CoA ligase [Clostridiales bacterium]
MGQKYINKQYFSPDTETATKKVLFELQSERLRNTVKICYEKVPMYRQRFDEIGIKPEDIKTIDDITKLPFTQKSDLRDNYPLGLVAVNKEDIARIHASSGTTGKQTVVAYTEKDIDVWAVCCARALTAAGCKKDDFVHISYGYGLFTGGLGLHYGAEKLGAATIPVSSGNTKRQVDILCDYGSDIICCTPSYALYIGETAKAMGIDTKKLKLRAGLFGAEAWTDEMRRELENSLNIKAYDIYGLSEIAGPGVAFECSDQTGMHINEDFFYPEVINPKTGESLPDGEYGELVFTCIYKEALPLIRYRTGDICALSHEKCSCGRTFVKMSRPRGRSDDMLIIRGINVFPSQIESVLLSLNMEPNYLIEVDRIKNMDTITVTVEIPSSMPNNTIHNTENIEKKITSAMHSALNITAKIKLVEFGSLPRFEGKAKRVVDKRKFE